MGLLAQVVAVLLATAQVCTAAQEKCKVIEGDAKWPSAETWKKELPTAYKQVAKSKQKHATYRIDVKNTDEVIAAVKFASKHNIRLNLLNSGHDFLGRNDSPNGLVLVTTDLKGIRISMDYKATAKGVAHIKNGDKVKVLQNSPQNAFVTFGVGYSTGELNKLTSSSKLITLGAAHEGVSVAGGWGQSGGHSPLSPKLGLGVDQVVEYKVVTADGKLRVANAVSEPDLFWALRGGGGGSWGVVVESTVKAFASPPIGSCTFWINTTDFSDHKSVFKPAAWLHTQFPEFSDQGLTNYYNIYPNAITVTSISSGKEGNLKFIDEKWQPILRKLGTFPGMNTKSIQYMSGEYPDFYTFFEKIIVSRQPQGNWNPMSALANMPKGSLPAGFPNFFGAGKGKTIQKRHGPGSEMMATQSTGVRGGDSWLLAKEHLNHPDFARVLEESMPKDMDNPQIRGQGIGGPGIFTRGKNNDTSVTPAWRKAYTHVIMLGSKDPVASSLRAIAPEMGAYVNEASRYTPGWRNAFWGPNYERLSSIKKKYDPDHLFWITPGINAEEWGVTGDRICRKAAVKIDAKQAAIDVAPLTDNPNWVDATAKGIDEYPGPDFMFLHSPKGPTINPVYLGAKAPKNSPEEKMTGGHSHGRRSYRPFRH